MTARAVGAVEQGVIRASMAAEVLRVALRATGGDVIAAARAADGVRQRAAALEQVLGQSRWVSVGGRWFPRLTFCGWPSPTFTRWAEAQLDPAASERYVSVALLGFTKRCGLACAHCSAAPELADRDAVSVEQWTAVVGALQARGLLQLHVTGGEPMARFDDLLRLLRGMAPGTDVWIDTAGVGLMPERAAALADAGLTGVAVSLDHWDPASHDRFRGRPGTFERALAACRAAADAGLVVAASLCPTRATCNAQDLDRYLSVVEAAGVSFVRVLEPRAAGRWAGAPDVRLEPAHVAALEAWTARSAGPTITHLDAVSRRVGCLVGGRMGLYVDTVGDAHGCTFCRDPVANVFTDGVDAAIDRLRARGCSTFARQGQGLRPPAA